MSEEQSHLRKNVTHAYCCSDYRILGVQARADDLAGFVYEQGGRGTPHFVEHRWKVLRLVDALWQYFGASLQVDLPAIVYGSHDVLDAGSSTVSMAACSLQYGKHLFNALGCLPRGLVSSADYLARAEDKGGGFWVLNL